MIGTLITLLIYLVIASLIWWVITYALANLPLPDPIARYGTVIATVIIVVVVVLMLLSLIQGGGLSIKGLG